MNAQPKYAAQLRGERKLADFIPQSSHVSPTTIVTQDGDYMRTWRIAGISYETQNPEDLLLRKEQMNTLWRALAGDSVAMWVHDLRRKTSDRLDSYFDNDFCREVDEAYYASFKNYRMMANETYLTVLYRPTPTRSGKLFNRAARRSAEELLQEQRAAMLKLDEIGYQVEASMSRYGGDSGRGIEPLTTYNKGGVVYSGILSMLNYLLTGKWQDVRVPAGPLNEYLGNSWVFVGTESIELRDAAGDTRYARCIDFKDYAEHTEPGILNGLMQLDCEYVMTQSFSLLSKRDGLKALNDQINQFRNSGDATVSQVIAMEDARDALSNGAFAMGEYHFSLMVFGDTMEAAKRNTTQAVTVLQDEGFLATLVTTATDAAFFAQLPGNWEFRPRIAKLTTQNFAGLACFHNFRTGKRDGNPWGDAITILKTSSGQPAYLNFHYAKGDEDAYNKKLLGNTRIIGQSGAGKTVLMNFTLCQAQKFLFNAPLGYTNVVLDKDQGSRLTVMAAGGKYLSIKNGRPTGFNPFQMEPTEANIQFLERLVKVLVTRDGERVSTADEGRISHAVRATMGMDKALRRLSVVLQSITEGTDKEDRENSVAKRLAKWCWDDGNKKRGTYWWVLDCQTDQIDFTTHNLYGFDGTDFLDNAAVCTPISMYLLHRMDSIIDGRRFVYWMDEAWKWVDDEAFAEFAGNKQLTIRKQDGLGVFATQMPSSLLKSKIASQLVQQVATEIYLPNPKADYHEYTQGFKVTDQEFRLIRAMGEESRMMLVKQGHQSFLCRLDLSGMDDILAILSGSTDNNVLLDEIIAEVGDEPSQWMPLFHARRKERVASSRRSEPKG